jgi:hypothetical protein
MIRTSVKSANWCLKASFVLALFIFIFRGLWADQPKKYVGAEVCGECHIKEYKMWLKGPHAKAFGSLNEERVNDIRCLLCHTTDARVNFSGFKFKGVQCEACHGSGAKYAHGILVDDFTKVHLKNLREQNAKVCRDCHGDERSPQIGNFVYQEKKEKIRHW